MKTCDFFVAIVIHGGIIRTVVVNILMSKKHNSISINVNLGCGDHIIPSNATNRWLNIDDYKLTKNKDFKQGSALAIPLEKESVDYLLMDQVLEHLAMNEVPMALYEVKRVLKKGGRFVITVPDFKSAAEDWLAFNHNEAFNPIVYHYVSEVVYGNQQHAGEFHKTPMSAGYLNFVLKMVGFTNYTLTFAPKNGKMPQLPGGRFNPEAFLRNSQIIADITK